MITSKNTELLHGYFFNTGINSEFFELTIIKNFNISIDNFNPLKLESSNNSSSFPIGGIIGIILGVIFVIVIVVVICCIKKRR